MLNITTACTIWHFEGMGIMIAHPASFWARNACKKDVDFIGKGLESKEMYRDKINCREMLYTISWILVKQSV